MIYILVGGDTNKKNLYVKNLTKGCEVFFIPSSELSKDIIFNHSSSMSLFGSSPVVVTDGVFSEKVFDFTADELSLLKESKTVFIFKEDKLTASDQKKYKKYGVVEIFEEKKIKTIQKFNTFSITDSFANRDKVGTWILYRKGIEEGISAEAIAGILFWKIKTMIMGNSRNFTKEELIKQSSSIVSLYHKSHLGEGDLVISLEQFILSSLSSKK